MFVHFNAIYKCMPLYLPDNAEVDFVSGSSPSSSSRGRSGHRLLNRSSSNDDTSVSVSTTVERWQNPTGFPKICLVLKKERGEKEEKASLMLEEVS